MGKKILTYLLKLILIVIFCIYMCLYIYFIEKNIFLALYFTCVFYIMYVFIIKMIVINSEQSIYKKSYRKIFFKIDTNNTLKNKKNIMDNADFLKKMQFLHFYFLVNPKCKEDIPQTFENDKNLLKNFIRKDSFNSLMKKLDNLSAEKRYKKLKKEKRDLTKKEFYQILHDYNYELYEEKMIQLLDERSCLNKKNYEYVIEVLVLLTTYCFPLIMYAEENDERLPLILSMFILGLLLVVLIAVFKPLYLKKLREENDDFIKKIEYFKQYKK